MQLVICCWLMSLGVKEDNYASFRTSKQLLEINFKTAQRFVTATFHSPIFSKGLAFSKAAEHMLLEL